MTRLDDIKARAEAATPGPWEAGTWYGTEHKDQPAPGVYWPVDHESCDVWPWHNKADMDFAYNARQDIPALLAVAEAAAAFVHGTYPDGRPFKGGDLNNAVMALEDRQ
jgi:hypothetical protein